MTTEDTQPVRLTFAEQEAIRMQLTPGASIFFEPRKTERVESLDEYQRKAGTTAVYEGKGTPEGLFYSAVNLTAEAGEVAGQLAKAVRDDKGKITPERRAAMLKEAGDALWQIAAVCTDLNETLSNVAQGNLDKLASRQKRGKLSGSGDNR